MALRNVEGRICTRRVLPKYVKGNRVTHVCIDCPIVRFTLVFLVVHACHVSTARCVESGEVALVEKGGVGDVESAFFLYYRSHKYKTM